MLSAEVENLARIVWHYHQMGHRIVTADIILVLGSHDLRVAERGAELYADGLAPRIVFSGGLGNLTRDLWAEPEAVKFARIAREKGVPEDAILLETRSTNTGENVRYTRELLDGMGLDPDRFILVQKPYMERRTYATFKKMWPEKEAIVTSPQISFDDYPNDEIPVERVIHIMVGDLQRIRIYPEKGFQIPQPIPDEVWNAYERLVALGFTDNLIR
ncbi:MAG TPA: YdcF family protein [Vicinamibacteria bacterium]|nr:YdcF family protein [Vicinamibacteria bacterium]